MNFEMHALPSCTAKVQLNLKPMVSCDDIRMDVTSYSKITDSKKDVCKK